MTSRWSWSSRRHDPPSAPRPASGGISWERLDRDTLLGRAGDSSARDHAGTPPAANCCGSMSWPGSCTAAVPAPTASSGSSRPSRSRATSAPAAPTAHGGYVLAAGPDGACDPQGRFWAGTMAYDEAPGADCLYRLELDGTCTRVLDGLTISNGIGWSPDGLPLPTRRPPPSTWRPAGDGRHPGRHYRARSCPAAGFRLLTPSLLGPVAVTARRRPHQPSRSQPQRSRRPAP